MKLILLTILTQFVVLSSYADEVSKAPMKLLTELGYKDAAPAPSAPGKGQELLMKMNGFADFSGPKKSIWENTPTWSVTGWDKVPQDTKDTVADAFTNDPEFLSYTSTMTKAVDMPCGLGTPADDSTHKAQLQRQIQYARFLANRTIFLLQAGRVEEGFKETLTGLRLMSKTFNGRTDALSGRVCLLIFTIHEPQILSLLSTDNTAPLQKRLLEELRGVETKILIKGELQTIISRALSMKADSLTDQERKRFLHGLQAPYMKSILSGKPHPDYLAAKAKFETETDAWLDNEKNVLLNQLVDIHKLTEPGRSYEDDLKLLKSLPSSPLEPKYSWRSMVSDERVFTAKCRLLGILVAANLHRLKAGSFPEKLADMDKDIMAEVALDPFTDEAFIYTVTDAKLTIYSLGPDQKDNAGKPFRTGGNRGDIVYTLAP